jgi:hypothetical protein
MRWNNRNKRRRDQRRGNDQSRAQTIAFRCSTATANRQVSAAYLLSQNCCACLVSDEQSLSKSQLGAEHMTFKQFSTVLVAGVTIGSAIALRADYSMTDIVDAAKRGDGHAVHRLIANGADLAARDEMGATALHWAGIRGNWRIFGELVEAGAPANAVGGDGGTPLHWACHHDRPDQIQILLDAGANLEVQNRWGRTPLHVAARRGCLDVVQLLLEEGADPNASTREGWTPLHVAARSGQEAVVVLLLENGADPSQKDADGLTASQSRRARPAAISSEGIRLDEYEGLYDLGRGFTVKVWKEDDVLRLREFAPDDLYPIARDEFACLREPWRVRFERDEDGMITAIEVDFLRRTVRGSRTDSPRYVGSAVCMECHSGEDQGSQDILWMRSRHAHAYWRLGSDWALYLAKLRPHYQDLETPIADERCLLCHVTGSQEPDALFSDSFRREEGVSCEACHGPGSGYATVDRMSDRAAFLDHGGRIPDEATCRGCHRNSDNFDFDEKWPKISHANAAPTAPTDE